MAWCVPITWNDPFAAQFSGSPFGGSTDGTAAVIPAGGTTEDLIKFWNDNNIPLGYTFRIEDGCICVDSEGVEPPTGIKVGFDPGDPTPTSGNHTANFSEIEKEPMTEKEEFLDACLQTLFGCSLAEWQEIFGTELTKTSIGAAIQTGVTAGGPVEESFTGEILGIFDWDTYGTNIPNDLDLISPSGPRSCDPDDTFGFLVVNLGLPATASGTAQTTFTVVDASAGWGSTAIYDKSTGQFLANTYPPGAGGAGNTVPVPFDHTISFTIPPGSDPTQICLTVNAFGSQGSGAFEGTCDEIGPGETIVTVTPDPCAAQAACFAALFGGCSVWDMLKGDESFNAFLNNQINEIIDNRVKCVSLIPEAVGEDALNFYPGSSGATHTVLAPGVHELCFPQGGIIQGSVTPILANTAEPDNDDIVAHVLPLGNGKVIVTLNEQDNGAAPGVPSTVDGFSGVFCCEDLSGGQGRPTEGAEINVVEGELQILLTNPTPVPVKFMIKRDPGRDSEVTVEAGSAKTQKYALGQETLVKVSVGSRLLAQKTVGGKKG